jgi:hypothetical protein
MKHVKNLRTLVMGAMLSVTLLASSVSGAYAVPSSDTSKKPVTPPSTSWSSGPQAQVPFEPGTGDAQATEKLGETNQIKVDAEGKPAEAKDSALPLAGNVAGVDFVTPANYCSRNTAYPLVKNSTATSKSVRILLWNQGMFRDLYVSVPAGQTIRPAFYGVNGAYTAYLYVLVGSTYQYDEYKVSNLTCNVSVTRTYNTGGWVRLKIQNLGTAYATQRSTELAPYPLNSTNPPYTGTQYDYPVAGGAAIERWFQVGTSPYGIVSDTLGSYNSPYYFSGDL